MTEQLGYRKVKFSKRLRRDFKLNGGLYVLAIIPFVYLILFKYWPMYGIQIAFKNYKVAKGIEGSAWVGLDNFARYFRSPMCWPTIRNTLIMGIYSLACFPLPILLAICLNYLPGRFFRKSVQMVSYIPHFISTVVMVGMLLQFTNKNYGMFNTIREAFGAEKINYMAKPAYFYHLYQWSGVWQNIGYSSIIYISALTAVPNELHEAATIDGASLVKRIFHVDLPCILPTVAILLILQSGSILNVGYEKVYLMQNNLNTKVSEVISTYVYKQGLESSSPQYSYSTAIDLFVSIVNASMMLLVNGLSKCLSDNSLM